MLYAVLRTTEQWTVTGVLSLVAVAAAVAMIVRILVTRRR
jgi:hypothetical protein